MRTFIALVRREVQEHQALVLGPVVFGVLALGAAIWLLSPWHSGPARDALLAPALIALFTPFVAPLAAILFLLDSLAGERRDRSIVFYRSLPVSDTKAIFAKLAAGFTVLPTVAYLMFLITGLLVMALIFLLGEPLLTTSRESDFGAMLQLFAVVLYWNLAGLVWFAPFAGYALLVSALFRRAPFLFAVVPLGIIPLENLLLGKSFLWQAISQHFIAFGRIVSGDRPLIPPRGLVPQELVPGSEVFTVTAARPIDLIDPSMILAEPRFWIGLAIAAACVTAAIQLRRHSDDGSA